MKSDWSHLEEFRLLLDTSGAASKYGTKRGEHFGAFCVPFSRDTRLMLIAAASDGETAEIVRVNAATREPFRNQWKEHPPTPEQMQFARQLFWDDDEPVIQDGKKLFA